MLNNQNLGRYPEFVFFVHGNEQRHLQKSLVDVPANISVFDFVSNMIKDNYSVTSQSASSGAATQSQPVPVMVLID